MFSNVSPCFTCTSPFWIWNPVQAFLAASVASRVEIVGLSVGPKKGGHKLWQFFLLVRHVTFIYIFLMACVWNEWMDNNLDHYRSWVRSFRALQAALTGSQRAWMLKKSQDQDDQWRMPQSGPYTVLSCWHIQFIMFMWGLWVKSRLTFTAGAKQSQSSLRPDTWQGPQRWLYRRSKTARLNKNDYNITYVILFPTVFCLESALWCSYMTYIYLKIIYKILSYAIRLVAPIYIYIL